MEDPPFIDECLMNSFNAEPFDEFNFKSFCSESYSSYPNFNPKCMLKTCQLDAEKPAEQLIKIDTWNSCTIQHITTRSSSSSTPNLISFENSNSPATASSRKFYENLEHCTMKPKDKMASQENMNFPPLISQGFHENQNYSPNSGQGNQRVNKTPLHAQDLVLAERKRREKLNQRFEALSALIPGLKKLDKASVLGDATKYLKQLQERVEMLEEQTSKKTMESVVL